MLLLIGFLWYNNAIKNEGSEVLQVKGTNHEKHVLSLKYGKEPGVLLDFMDMLYDTGATSAATAYNYYMTARSLAKYLKKWRLNLPCAPEEVIMSGVSAEELLQITEDEWERYLHYYHFSCMETNGSTSVRISVICRLYMWLAQTHETEPPAFILQTVRPSARHHEIKKVPPAVQADIFRNLKGDMLMRNACIITLFLDCGIGLEELTELRMEDIGLEEIRVRDSSGRYRVVPLSDRAKESIEAYLPVRIPPLDQENTFFTSAKKGKLSRQSIQKMVRKAIRPLQENLSIRDMQRNFLAVSLEESGPALAAASAKAGSGWYLRQQLGLSSNPSLLENKYHS